MPVACNNPTFDFNLYYSTAQNTVRTAVVVPLITFKIPENLAQFKTIVSFIISSDIPPINIGDTYELLNYKRTMTCDNTVPRSITYNQGMTSLVAAFTEEDGLSGSNITFYSKVDYDLANNSLRSRVGYISLRAINLGQDDYDFIDGFDINTVDPTHDYLLYLEIEIPMVGFNLECDIKVHNFMSNIPYSSFGDLTAIYPYSTIGYYDDGVVYIPDTGDNELYIGEP